MKRLSKLTTSLAIAFSSVFTVHAVAEALPFIDKQFGGDITPQIVGGGPANTANWQFYTQILNSNGSTAFCGGSYIGDGYVLTAAHCVSSKSARFIDAKVAGFRLGGTDGDRIGVVEKYVHPQYNRSTLNYDVALLKLERHPTQGQAVQLASGSLSQYARSGDMLSVAGLGRLSEGGSRPSFIQEVDVPLVSDAVCNQSGGNYANVGSVAFCAGYPQGQQDSCSGDSGGPIVINRGGQIVQLGSVSWGIGCARPDKYGVYADVAALSGWIDGIKQGDSSPSLTYTQNRSLANFSLFEVVNHRFTIRNSGSQSASLNAVNVSGSGVTSGLVVTSDSVATVRLAATKAVVSMLSSVQTLRVPPM